VQLVFDFPEQPGAQPQRRVFRAPREILQATQLQEVRLVLRRVQQAAAAGLHAAGFLSYEAAPAFDPALRVRDGHRFPLAWFGLFDRAHDASAAAPVEADASLSALQPDTSHAEYAHALRSIRRALADGETYQVNYTLRLRGRAHGNAAALYERLRAAQGGGYAAFLDLDEFAILSASPELFFQRSGGRIIAKPMKGTRPRGRFPEEDRAAAETLRNSAKDRAENLMIVDLLRNDIGRIARTGTVAVPRMFELERYHTVWQLTSTIAAELPAEATVEDIFGALFPCGSVTGAPKVSTMRLIASLERSPREVYCGAIGCIEPGGNATFNVPIRTLWLDAAGMAEYGVGGGITWDSTTEGEYEEALAKAALLHESWPEFALLETMRMQDGIPRLERHIARMRDSADYFGFTFDETRVRQELQTAAARSSAAPARLRVLLDACGGVTSEVRALDDWPGQDVRVDEHGRYPVTMAQTPVSSADRFLFHKTTNRGVYDSRRAQRPDVLDVLLRNEHGQVTEFTIGNVVALIDGVRWTPPVTDGLLAGVFRQELLERGEVQQRSLTLHDVRRAERLWLVNSVREWVEVFLL
jgi:para-aminobenzoate synthetase/4-amino-4-deoxychorismate lyase